jgi:hypothetical protein
MSAPGLDWRTVPEIDAARRAARRRALSSITVNVTDREGMGEFSCVVSNAPSR